MSTPMRRLAQKQNYQLFRLKGAWAGLRSLREEGKLPHGSSARAHLQLAIEFSSNAIESLKKEHEIQRADLRRQLGLPEPRQPKLKLPHAEE